MSRWNELNEEITDAMGDHLLLARENGLKVFAQRCKELFLTCPDLQSFSWSQGTEYNDEGGYEFEDDIDRWYVAVNGGNAGGVHQELREAVFDFLTYGTAQPQRSWNRAAPTPRGLFATLFGDPATVTVSRLGTGNEVMIEVS